MRKGKKERLAGRSRSANPRHSSNAHSLCVIGWIADSSTPTMRTPVAASPLLAAMMIVCSVAISAAAADNCAALGFGDALLCSDCARLESFVSDASLTSECLGCCSATAKEDESAPYISGVLKICS